MYSCTGFYSQGDNPVRQQNKMSGGTPPFPSRKKKKKGDEENKHQLSKSQTDRWIALNILPCDNATSFRQPWVLGFLKMLRWSVSPTLIKKVLLPTSRVPDTTGHLKTSCVNTLTGWSYSQSDIVAYKCVCLIVQTYCVIQHIQIWVWSVFFVQHKTNEKELIAMYTPGKKTLTHLWQITATVLPSKITAQIKQTLPKKSNLKHYFI